MLSIEVARPILLVERPGTKECCDNVTPAGFPCVYNRLRWNVPPLLGQLFSCHRMKPISNLIHGIVAHPSANRSDLDL
jgi:hypothetical protein